MVTEFFGTFLFRLLSHVHDNYSGCRKNLKFTNRICHRNCHLDLILFKIGTPWHQKHLRDCSTFEYAHHVCPRESFVLRISSLSQVAATLEFIV